MLNHFYNSKQLEIAALAEQESSLCKQVFLGKRPGFNAALTQNADDIAIIAEYKRASPSAGAINLVLSPEDAGRQYLEAGANALSVLTEETKFQGDISYLQKIHTATQGRIPLLRKDFIFHPLQVTATAGTPASAFLLIVALTPDAEQLRTLRELGAGYGMEAIVEVFNKEELHLARESGARLIQVNARDLRTFNVDRQSVLTLADQERSKAPDETWIAASGMETALHLRQAKDAGFDAALIGTGLMRGGNPAQALACLRSGPSVGGEK